MSNLSRLWSRKLAVTIGAILVVIFGQETLPTDVIDQLVNLVLVYVGGQSIVDAAKDFRATEATVKTTSDSYTV